MRMEYIKGSNLAVTKNFRSYEFDCKGYKCCDVTVIDPNLAILLQKIRDSTNSPVTITSGYRCSTHNKEVGGASKSYHMQGMAADIVIRDLTPAQVAETAELCGATGIGLYENFVHVDVRPDKYFWIDKTGKQVDTFVTNKAAAMAAEIKAIMEKYGY